MKILVYFLILVSLCCGNSIFQEFFESTELISSVGEHIYINTVVYGVSSDHQLTIITKNKNKLNNNDQDTVGTSKSYSPFIYKFSNDTLTLFFYKEINYRIKESFQTIAIVYNVLGDEEYSALDILARENKEYFQVPKYHQTEYPLDMPKPPNKN